MTNRFMISVAAAALIAGTGLANAQGTGTGRDAPSAGSTAQQSAPSSERGNSSAPTNRDAVEPSGSSSGMKATQSEQKSPGAAKNQRAEDKDGMQGQKSKGMSSENDNAKSGGKDMKAEGREGRKDNMKAEGREDRNGKMNAEGREGRDGNMNAEQKGGAERSQTVGQAGAGAKLSTEQRTKITTVIRSQRVDSVAHVDFSISRGVRVPRTVSFHPLPSEVVSIYPEWRGYEYFLVNDRIVVVDPRTLEIVDVIDS